MLRVSTQNPSDIEAVLAPRQAAGPRRRALLWGLAVLLTAALGGGGLFLFQARGHAPAQYRTAVVEQGRLTVRVTATGTLEPVNVVEVGTEVSGTLALVAADYNDRIAAGQLLARLDTTKLEGQVAQSRAALDLVRAGLMEAQASGLEADNELQRLEQVRRLSGGRMPSEHDLHAAQAALQRARAAEARARAEIAQAEARLKIDQTDLAKAVIVSPIDGVILERNVEPGQTVAASLQTPVLFKIAEDLSQMELHVEVDEADVGQVREGQPATFTVDAYPERTFAGRVTQVRYASTSENGVVTYETLLTVDNEDLALRPGMTATADITVQAVADALLVPNTALRFTPSADADSPTQRRSGLVGSLIPRPPRHAAKSRAAPAAPGPTGPSQRVWTLMNGQPVPVSVATGISDGIKTQVLGGDLAQGQVLVVDRIASAN